MGSISRDGRGGKWSAASSLRPLSTPAALSAGQVAALLGCIGPGRSGSEVGQVPGCAARGRGRQIASSRDPISPVDLVDPRIRRRRIGLAPDGSSACLRAKSWYVGQATLQQPPGATAGVPAAANGRIVSSPTVVEVIVDRGGGAGARAGLGVRPPLLRQAVEVARPEPEGRHQRQPGSRRPQRATRAAAAAIGFRQAHAMRPGTPMQAGPDRPVGLCSAHMSSASSSGPDCVTQVELLRHRLQDDRFQIAGDADGSFVVFAVPGEPPGRPNRRLLRRRERRLCREQYRRALPRSRGYMSLRGSGPVAELLRRHVAGACRRCRRGSAAGLPLPSVLASPKSVTQAVPFVSIRTRCPA